MENKVYAASMAFTTVEDSAVINTSHSVSIIKESTLYKALTALQPYAETIRKKIGATYYSLVIISEDGEQYQEFTTSYDTLNKRTCVAKINNKTLEWEKHVAEGVV